MNENNVAANKFAPNLGFLIFTLSIINCVFYTGACEWYGGYISAGKVECGRYYLGRRGRQYVEVGERVYMVMNRWSDTVFGGIIVGIMAMAASSYIHGDRKTKDGKQDGKTGPTGSKNESVKRDRPGKRGRSNK